ncbi:phosphoenolpyruvate synthase [archaeon]|jgi:pyruvate, water dikinase|nr:phosphoenolpyruvate synthase [archaeon]
MVNILWFKDVNKDSIPQVGGKGANLGEMTNARFHVPRGFVVTADAYKQFLEKTDIQPEINNILSNLDIENSNQLNEKAKQVEDLILEQEMPETIKQEIAKSYNEMDVNKEALIAAGAALQFIRSGRESPFVAVRSSATAEDLPEASFAGQQSTFLNVKNASNVVQAVKQCWASLYTARAIYYREKNGFEHEKVFIAVIIQKMINSEKAGVMFSINPTTNNENEIIIEAGFGLGDAIVSGSISPDRYVVVKNPLSIKDKNINHQAWMFIRDVNTGRTIKKEVRTNEREKQKLTDDEILKLATLAKRIEKHYGVPQDIEFAIDNGTFIVQTRPITTIKKTEEIIAETSKSEETKNREIFLEGIAASPGIGKGTVKIINNKEELHKIKKGDVLVAKMTNPDYVAVMERASAIITDEGGSTCHAAIVSREMGIPAVVGTMNSTEKLQEGDRVIVNGSTGKVYKDDSPISEIEKISLEEHKPEIIKKQDTLTQIKVNIDIPHLVDRAAQTGADGIGLLRCEFMILNNKDHPSYMIKQGRKDELVEGLVKDLKTIVSKFEGKPVWYRTLDAPTDEFRNMHGGENEPHEDNPMMGWRSIRRDLDEPELLKAQFEAIKKVRESGLTNIGIMIPLVTGVKQIKKAKEILREVGLEPQKDIKFGIMVETPAAVQMIKDFCEEGIDFVSIGTNDLTQFTLAVDRNNAKIQKLYSPMHPAVLRQIKHVINICKKYDVTTSICGQAGSNEKMARYLTKIGIDSISANIDAVNKISQVVAEEEKKLLLESRNRNLYK